MRIPISFVMLVGLSSVSALKDGEFKVCSNSNFGGNCRTFNVFDFNERTINSLPKDVFDNISSVDWNLPDGFAVTLMNDRVGNFEDVVNTRNLDLVKTGTIANLKNFGVNDVFSAWTFFSYDDTLGFVEVFEDPDFTSFSKKIFLSLFEPNTVISMNGWALNDDIASMKWNNLVDTASVEFFQSSNGSGNQFAANGFSSSKSVRNFGDFGLNNQFSSFRWSLRQPVKQEIEDLRFDLPENLEDGDRYLAETEGRNEFPTEQVFELSIEETNARSITTTVSESVTTEFGLEVAVTFTPPPTGGTGGSITFSFSQSTTSTFEQSIEETTTLGVSVSQTIVIPGSTVFDAQLLVITGQLPPTTVTTVAKRFYDVRVANSVLDSASGLFVRDETISLTFEGDAAFKTILNTSFDPIEGCTSSGGLRGRRHLAAQPNDKKALNFTYNQLANAAPAPVPLV